MKMSGTDYVQTGVAQLVEHRSPKPGVGSSSLSSRANRTTSLFIRCRGLRMQN